MPRFFGDPYGGTVLPLFTPANTITVTKNGSNPTLTDLGSVPENILKVGTTYYLAYTRRTVSGWTIRLAHASTPNPSSWTLDGIILTGTGIQPWEAAASFAGCCLIQDGGTFYLFFGSDPPSTTPGIGYATASTITGPYTRYVSNPVLSPGGAGTWDERRCVEPSVIKVGSTYVMAYMGESMTGSQGQSEKIGIATATALAGPWTKVGGNPLIGFGAGGEFDDTGAADPSIYYDGTRYWVWYSGLSGTLGAEPWQSGLAYASTPDGAYTKHTSNPILVNGAGGSFDEKAAWRGSLFVEGGVVYVVYGGEPASAVSSDAKGGEGIFVIT